MKAFTAILLGFYGFLSFLIPEAKSLDGLVVGWGQNVLGEASGVPNNYLATNFVTIRGRVLTNVLNIAADGNYGLALRSDGTVAGWGNNSVGQATGGSGPAGPLMLNGNVLRNVVEIAAGDLVGYALKADGTVSSWGYGAVPAGLSNVTTIVARGVFGTALKKSGTVVSWGTVPWAAATDVPEGLSNVVAIACGGINGGQSEGGMALKKDGTVVVWVSNLPHLEPVPAEVSNVVAIAAGAVHSLALKQDGTVFGWGYNGEGEATGVPTPGPPSSHCFSSGLVRIDGQLLSNVVAISSASVYNLALKKDGTVVAWGDHRFYKDIPPGLSNVVAIAAGEDFCLAISTNISATAFGK